MNTLCRHGFEVMRLHSLALWVVPESKAAMRHHRKVGSREDGRHRDAFRGGDRRHGLVLTSPLEREIT